MTDGLSEALNTPSALVDLGLGGDGSMIQPHAMGRRGATRGREGAESPKRRAALSASDAGATPEAVAPSAGDSHSEYHLSLGDAVTWLEGLDSSSVDLIVTDPPYESLEKHRAVGTTTRLKHSKASSNDWFRIFPNERFPELFAQLYRVLRPHRHFYLFCDAETMFVAKPAAEAAGFKFWKPLVWDKRKIGMGYHYRARYEFILFFEKGKRKLSDLGIADILECPRIFKGYPTEKPAHLSRLLIEQSTDPGELVVDPFMGSGSVGVAALESRRSFLGNDISSQALEHTQTRLAALGQNQPSLLQTRLNRQSRLL